MDDVCGVIASVGLVVQVGHEGRWCERPDSKYGDSREWRSVCCNLRSAYRTIFSAHPIAISNSVWPNLLQICYLHYVSSFRKWSHFYQWLRNLSVSILFLPSRHFHTLLVFRFCTLYPLTIFCIRPILLIPLATPFVGAFIIWHLYYYNNLQSGFPASTFVLFKMSISTLPGCGFFFFSYKDMSEHICLLVSFVGSHGKLLSNIEIMF